MTRRLLPLAALATGTALLLTACGGGEEPSDRIAGADDGKKSSSPAADPSPEQSGAPDIALPEDVEVTVEQPSGKGSADVEAARSSLAYAIEALVGAKAEGSGDTEPMLHAYEGEAGLYWAEQIDAYRKSGKTISGDYGYYDLDVEVREKDSASGTYCEDQRKAYGKDRKTGEVNRTTPSDDDFFLYTVKMRKSDGHWKVSQVHWEKGAESCVRS